MKIHYQYFLLLSSGNSVAYPYVGIVSYNIKILLGTVIFFDTPLSAQTVDKSTFIEGGLLNSKG